MPCQYGYQALSPLYEGMLVHSGGKSSSARMSGIEEDHAMDKLIVSGKNAQVHVALRPPRGKAAGAARIAVGVCGAQNAPLHPPSPGLAATPHSHLQCSSRRRVPSDGRKHGGNEGDSGKAFWNPPANHCTTGHHTPRSSEEPCVQPGNLACSAEASESFKPWHKKVKVGSKAWQVDWLTRNYAHPLVLRASHGAN